MPPTDSTSLTTPPLSPPKRRFPGSSSPSGTDVARPLALSHAWPRHLDDHGGAQEQNPREPARISGAKDKVDELPEEEEDEPPMKSPLSDSALLATPRHNLRTADKVGDPWKAFDLFEYEGLSLY